MDENNYKKGVVSIGIPTFNRPENLEKALKCIISQSYKNIEIIVSDNCTPGNKVKNIVDIYSKYDARIKYFKQETNIGVLANAEFVLKQATGEFFTWFSDDDWRAPEFIENMVYTLNSNLNLNMVFCDYYEVYENGNRAKGYPNSHLKFFKPFQSKNRLLRIISYYWQNSIYGKCNLFYSVFRKKSLDLLDIYKTTDGYKHLNMDNLIIFQMLQIGPVAINNEIMCTLTCGNEKYYFENSTKNSKSSINSIVNIFKTYLIDRKLYFNNTSSLLEKALINTLFIPKIVSEFTQIIINKLISSFEFTYKKKSEASKNDSFKEKIQLSKVSLIAVATRNVEQTLEALLYSSRNITFQSIKLFSHYTPFCNDERVEFIRIPKMKNIDEWSKFIVYELNNYISTDYVLLVHADGFVVNPDSWRDEFLNYDYIGSPWPLPSDDFSYRDINGDLVRVGNSVSLRSKKILELPNKLEIPWEADHGYFNEDGFLCVKNKHILEENGIKFAPLNVAKYFAHEKMIPEIKNIKPFAFHKWEGTNSLYPKFK